MAMNQVQESWSVVVQKEKKYKREKIHLKLRANKVFHKSKGQLYF